MIRRTVSSKPARLSGFTLIELLVVITIIAILAAILFPVFASAREKARQASCMSNGKEIGLGIMQYVQDYDEILPYGDNRANCGTATPDPNCQSALFSVYGAAGNGILWPTVVAPYINKVTAQNGGRYFTGTDVFFCPDVPAKYANNVYSAITAWTCNDRYYGANSGYGIMANNTGAFGFTTLLPMPIAKFSRPAEIILMAEAWHVQLGVPLGTMPGPFDQPAKPSQWGQGILSRHNGGSNCIFADGHVKWYKEDTLRLNSGDIWGYSTI